MAEENTIIVLNDGTLQADVLEKECEQNPNIKVKSVSVKSDPKNLEKMLDKLTKADKEKVIYLPFTMEQFIEHSIEDQRLALRTKFPELGIFYAYEFMNMDTVLERARGFKIEKKAVEIEKEEEKNADND